MPEDKSRTENNVLIKSRREASVSGIKSILGFADDYITLDTECGRLDIEGEDLRIEELTKEEGTVYIKGRISALYYSEIKKGKALFKGLKK